MSKKTCKHNRTSKVLPYLWIGGTKKHTEYVNDAPSMGEQHIVVTNNAPSFVTGNVRYFVCPNYGIPNATTNWWSWEVTRYKVSARRAVATVVTDLGGHGRSGLYCAIIMAHILGISGKEAIARLRQLHCEQAVETPEQEAYVVRIADELRNWKG